MSMLERLAGSGWGTIEIELDIAPLTFGDTVDGSVTVTAKQAIGPGLLTIALVCQERQSRVVPVKNGRRIGASRQAQRREIWRNELAIDEGIILDDGESLTAPWSLQVPEFDPGVSPAAQDLPDWAKGTLAVLDNLTMANSSRAYRLVARFEHPGGFSMRRNMDVHIH